MALNVGLDIGTTAVRASVVQTGKGTPKLRRYGQVSLPRGTIVGGEIVDEAVMKDALQQLWKTVKLPKKRVIVGIANQRVIVRRIDIDYMDEAQLAESLPFQAQEYIPIPVDEAILDFVPLEEFTTPDGQAMMSVLIVAAQRSMAAEVLSVVQSVGAKVMALDLQAFGLVRSAFGASLNPATGTVALVDIGGSVTQVMVVKDGTVRFLRSLSMGGEDFTDDLSAGIDLGRDQAEQVKRRIGVAVDGDGTEGDTTDRDARKILTRRSDELIEEVRGSLDYYLTQSTGDTIDTVYIAGNGARLPHLANRMARRLDTPIEPVRMLDGTHLDVGKTGLSETELLSAQPVLPISAGLAVWSEA